MSQPFKPFEPQASYSAAKSLLSRRGFLATSSAACAGALFVAYRGSNSTSAAAADLPAVVTIVQFSPDGHATGKISVPRIIKPDDDWKSQLSPLSYEVTRHAGTERPYSDNMLDVHDKGLFRCICCDTALFNSRTKFDSGTGWPSFWQSIARENVVEVTDRTLGMARTAVSCRECDAHLGHVFDDGPAPTHRRYCMNAAAMRFVKA